VSSCGSRKKTPASLLIFQTARTAVNGEATYVCGACGEEIVIPIDLSQGDRQEYVEDCPVCCRANVIRVEVDADGEVSAWAELE
jgi:hypothetical protein